uniref:Uncharacterized protein n=1 Tax=Anguilla anguilla TaxID=7936 RepID=A0A0E9R1T8_ANGAN
MQASLRMTIEENSIRKHIFFNTVDKRLE